MESTSTDRKAPKTVYAEERLMHQDLIKHFIDKVKFRYEMSEQVRGGVMFPIIAIYPQLFGRYSILRSGHLCKPFQF